MATFSDGSHFSLMNEDIDWERYCSPDPEEIACSSHSRGRRRHAELASTPRFRKRDKLRYYAVRFGRKFSSITEKLKDIKSPETRRMLIVAFVKKLLNIPEDSNVATLKTSRLPESFYEPDEDDDPSFPDDLKLIISSIRVFGHLEKYFFIEFCKFIENIRLETGDYLFRVGEPDDNVYVVHTGKVRVCAIETAEITGDETEKKLVPANFHCEYICQIFVNAFEDGSRSVITEVSRGGSIESFLSVLNVLTCNTSSHETMEAVALEPSVVLRLPIRSFLEICQPQTPALMRILQMVTIRLQRLSAVTIQSHLGLCAELIQKESICNVEGSVAQALLQKLIPPQPLSEQASVQSTTVDLEPSVLPHARGSICPLGSDCIELNTAGEVITDFGLNQESRTKCRERHSVCGVLELGEAPLLLNDASKNSEQAGASRSYSFDHSAYGESPFNNLRDAMEDGEQSQSLLAPGTAKRAMFQGLLNLNKDEESQLMTAIAEDMAKLLQIPDPSILKDRLQLASAAAGTVMLEEAQVQTELFYVLSGEVHGMQGSAGHKACNLFVCQPGDFVGLLGLITGEPNVYALKATVPTVVALLGREEFYAVVRENPDILISAIRIISARVSPLLHQLDFAIQWLTIPAGKALYKKGDSPDYFYVVLSGRMRLVDIGDHGRRIAGESGRGDMVGLLEVICTRTRVHDVIAIRDSEVAQIPSLLLHHLKHKVPGVLDRIIQLLSGRLLGNITTAANSSHLGVEMTDRAFEAYTIDGGAGLTKPDTKVTDVTIPQLSRTTMANLRTIAILPTSSAINAEAFTLELQHSLTPIGSSVRFTSRIIRRRLGATALSSVNRYRLNAWLSHQEDLHRIVFFVCNYTRSSAWNRLCLRQADSVLVLALASSDPCTPSPIELTLKNNPTKVIKTLILMYPLTTDYPVVRQTAKWLNARPWVGHHYHIRCEPRVLSAPDATHLISFYSNVFARERPDPLSDFSRLARYLTNEAIGLVLGGGGARGCSHVGIIRAFLEAGIPIDLIGGTSIGAFMSALWAEETRFAQFTQRARDFSSVFNSVWNKIKDFTYPAVSIFSGREFNNRLEAVFGDRQVEDLWIPSFYVSTDITNCKMRFHVQGSLWRYVRASMSLSGYLPPLCDPYDGNMLLDGGYTNNVPADVMSAFGAKTIFAVDVGASVDTDFTNYGDHLSGWDLLYHRFFRSNRTTMRVPNLSEIQARLAYISCVRQLEHVKDSRICHYLRPPIDRFMTLQFSAFDEILNVGYEYGKHTVYNWQKEGLLKQLIPGYRPHMHSGQPTPKHTPVEEEPVNQFVPTRWFRSKTNTHQRFVDLAETVTASGFISHGSSPFTQSESEDKSDNEMTRSHTTRQRSPDRDQVPESVSSLPSDSGGVRDSLSRAVYSYLHSAKHLVYNTLPSTGFFRRRALSVNLGLPSDVSMPGSSDDDAGHFSDAQDYPVRESPSTGQILNRPLSNYQRLRSGSYSGSTPNDFCDEHTSLPKACTDNGLAPTGRRRMRALRPDSARTLDMNSSDLDEKETTVGVHTPLRANAIGSTQSEEDAGYRVDCESDNASIEQPAIVKVEPENCEVHHMSGEESSTRSHRLHRRSSLNRRRSITNPDKAQTTPEG